ncbi:MAG TPA: DNA polymerase I, partial [Actinobacteria bacterium]|nr:DNA polymerase I [Actinomycetota bacterium]
MADSERQANHSLSTDRPLYHRPMPTLALLDGHSLAYRAFYALPEDLATESGQVTNAVYGFTSMLIKLLDDHAPDGLVVAWDVGRATFRTQEYPEYKAQRAASPDNFNSQVPLIKKVAETLQIPQFAKEGFEADDLIATLARHAAGAGWDVLVVTGDRDSFQLVDETIKVVYTRRGISDIVVADEAWITDKYGIRPDQYNEYAALRGDNSDNLPGVPGVGEKTAARLIAGYGTLESIYEHLDEQTPKLRDNLAVSRDQVFLNRRLMRLVDDVELDIDLEDFHRTVPDRQATKDLFDSLEFHSLWQRLVDLDGGVAASEVEEIDVEIRSLSADSEIEALSGSGLVVEPVRDGGRLVGLMVVLTDQEAAFVPADRLEPLRAALADPTVAIAADHAKDLISDLFDLGYEVSGLVFDPALANYVIDPASRSHALEDVAERILSIELSSADEDDDERSQGTLDFGGGPDLDLAARRAVATARLREPLETLMDERGVRILYD